MYAVQYKYREEREIRKEFDGIRRAADLYELLEESDPLLEANADANLHHEPIRHPVKVICKSKNITGSDTTAQNCRSGRKKAKSRGGVME